MEKTHPDAIHPKPSGVICRSTHAEHHALIYAKPGDELFVMRFYKTGGFCIAKPCPECQTRIAKLKLKAVWYTDFQGEWQKLKI